jgi:RsiW-degrading membrane proteinase PrsW (M82 family)
LIPSIIILCVALVAWSLLFARGRPEGEPYWRAFFSCLRGFVLALGGLLFVACLFGLMAECGGSDPVPVDPNDLDRYVREMQPFPR